MDFELILREHAEKIKKYVNYLYITYIDIFILYLVSTK